MNWEGVKVMIKTDTGEWKPLSEFTFDGQPVEVKKPLRVPYSHIVRQICWAKALMVIYRLKKR